MIVLEIGKDYIDVKIDFLTKEEIHSFPMRYMGLHPFDDRHMFCVNPVGSAYIPQNGEALERLRKI